MGSAASSYYITLVAIDPATQLLQTFQTRVNELRYGELVLECCTARPLGNFFFFFFGKTTSLSHCWFWSFIGETHICGIKKSSDHKPVEDLLHTFPEWPPKNPFKKSKRCYVVRLPQPLHCTFAFCFFFLLVIFNMFSCSWRSQSCERMMIGFVYTWNSQLPRRIGTPLRTILCPTWRLSK